MFISIPKAEKIVAEKAAHLLFIKIYVIILYIRKNQQLTKLLFFVIIIMGKNNCRTGRTPHFIEYILYNIYTHFIIP